MSTELIPDIATLKSSLESQGVKYAVASYVDIHGMSKAKMVPLSHFGQMMQGSELFTGAAFRWGASGHQRRRSGGNARSQNGHYPALE
jgi:glutamine synthetase